MRLSTLRLAAALCWYHGVRPTLARPEPQGPAQTSSSEVEIVDTETMTDPADRTYPTTITTIKSATSTVAASIVYVDTTTLLEPWPVSPDFELIPMTMFQTAITARTISTVNAAAGSNTPTTTTLTTTSTYIMWGTAPTDMVPNPGPACAQAQGAVCNPPAVKQHYRCDELKRDTRCEAQCLLKDWLWWCYKQTAADKGKKPMGKVCFANSTTYEQLLEPCDHTDFAGGDCLRCAEGQQPFGPGEGENGE